MHFGQKSISFNITSKDVLKDCLIVSLSLLLNLQDMHVLRELFNFLTSDGIDQCGLTDTVTTDETILTTLHKLELRLIKKRFTTNDQSQIVDQDVSLEWIRLIVNDDRGRNVLLVLNEFLYLFVKGVLGSLLFLGLFEFRTERVLSLHIVVTFCLIGIQEWIKEFFLSVDS